LVHLAQVVVPLLLVAAPSPRPARFVDAELLKEASIPEADRPRSFGGTRRFYRLDRAAPGAPLRFPLDAGAAALFQEDSLRLFRLDPGRHVWEVVPESRYDAAAGGMVGAAGAGTYTVLGASRFEDVFGMQQAVCGARGRPADVPKICQVILCTGDLLAGAGSGMGYDLPGGIPPGDVFGTMGGVCEQCLKGPGGPLDFAECHIPQTWDPLPFPKPDLIPWPVPRGCFDASNACRPGPYNVGQSSYDFPDALQLVATGGASAYPNVDVRAVVRYPAASSGVDTPIANRGPFPLAVFLHGNHTTCTPCSCDHSCAPAARVPSHAGYNYLLDLLASWGIIAVSIDGFDVTCAWSPNMTDYEGRARLVLEHLRRWTDWNALGTDPWGGRFKARVNLAKIGLSGHSRGGEGVVAAEYLNRTEGLGYKIVAVNAIAPTDQDAYVRYEPEVPYFLLLAASDGDVSNLQGLRTYDRAFPTGAAAQAEKSTLWVYGANHNFFNTAWSPSSGTACAFDDGTGGGRISDSEQRLVACQSILPFFRLHLQNATGYRKLFRGEVVPVGLQGVRMYWSYQDPKRLTVDDYEAGDNPATNSLGGAASGSGGFATFDEYEFKSGGPDTFNASFFHFTHGLVLGWNANQAYETVLPVASRNVSTYSTLSLRAAQVIHALNPVNGATTLRVTLRTTGGATANVNFDTAGVLSVPYPYPDNGGKTVLGTLRVPLEAFRAGTAALPLNDIERVIIEVRGTGVLAIDDVAFTR
jgi:hypothetical protein